MKRKIFGNKGGFTLVEVVAAMVVLAIIAAPVGGALAVSWRVNAYADRVMQARLDVSTAAETLMAKGIDVDKINADNYYTESFPGSEKVIIQAKSVTESGLVNNLYEVTITSNTLNSVSVTTHIRAMGVGDGEGSGT